MVAFHPVFFRRTGDFRGKIPQLGSPFDPLSRTPWEKARTCLLSVSRAVPVQSCGPRIRTLEVLRSKCSALVALTPRRRVHTSRAPRPRPLLSFILSMLSFLLKDGSSSRSTRSSKGKNGRSLRSFELSTRSAEDRDRSTRSSIGKDGRSLRSLCLLVPTPRVVAATRKHNSCVRPTSHVQEAQLETCCEPLPHQKAWKGSLEKIWKGSCSSNRWADEDRRGGNPRRKRFEAIATDANAFHLDTGQGSSDPRLPEEQKRHTGRCRTCFLIGTFASSRWLETKVSKQAHRAEVTIRCF